MNVFVLGTGRCGTKAFAAACREVSNYTAGHETRWQAPAHMRLAYPDQHIEVDNRLCWYLGQLLARYGEQAFYVHLRRDRDAVVRSFVRREEIGVMSVWPRIMTTQAGTSMEDCAADYVDAVTANLDLFIRERKHSQTIWIETAAEDVSEFAGRIGAMVDCEAAARHLRQGEEGERVLRETPSMR